MKAKRRAIKTKAGKQRSDKKPALEDVYRQVFSVPLSIGRVRDRLSIYKPVPSITTYGLYEKPV